MIFLHDSICKRNYHTKSLSIEIQTENHKDGMIAKSYSTISIVSKI